MAGASAAPTPCPPPPKAGGGGTHKVSLPVLHPSKAGRADFVFMNDGTLEQLDAFVEGVLGQLVG